MAVYFSKLIIKIIIYEINLYTSVFIRLSSLSPFSLSLIENEIIFIINITNLFSHTLFGRTFYLPLINLRINLSFEDFVTTLFAPRRMLLFTDASAHLPRTSCNSSGTRLTLKAAGGSRIWSIDKGEREA